MPLLCRLGWHGGALRMGTYCVDYGRKWALMECSRCGARYIWERGHLDKDTAAALKEKHERGPQE